MECNMDATKPHLALFLDFGLSIYFYCHTFCHERMLQGYEGDWINCVGLRNSHLELREPRCYFHPALLDWMDCARPQLLLLLPSQYVTFSEVCKRPIPRQPIFHNGDGTITSSIHKPLISPSSARPMRGDQ